MIINKKLFDDLFLVSHKKLALKSIQTLIGSKDFIVFEISGNEFEIFAVERNITLLDSRFIFKIKCVSENGKTNINKKYLIFDNHLYWCMVAELIDDYDVFNNINVVIATYPTRTLLT